MSRSYKKTPIVKDGQHNAGSRKWWKRQANKKIRRGKWIQRKKSKDFRKSGIDSWDICDYRTYWQRSCDMESDDLEFWKNFILGSDIMKFKELQKYISVISNFA